MLLPSRAELVGKYWFFRGNLILAGKKAIGFQTNWKGGSQAAKPASFT